MMNNGLSTSYFNLEHGVRQSDPLSPTSLLCLTPIGLGFFYMLRFGGETAPLLSSLFVDLSKQNFVQGLTIKALHQIWKKLHKINDVIDSDVIILRNLAKKTVKRVYFKIAAASSSFTQFY